MRRFGLLLFVAALIPLATTANAWAQGGTMQVSDQTVTPGQTINVTASTFSNDSVRASPAQLRLDRRTAPSLANATVAGDGTIDTDVTIPANTTPGWHLLIATQTWQGGNQRSFGPARVRLLVSAQVAGSAAPGGSGSGPIVPLALGLGLMLLLAGAVLAARRHHRLPARRHQRLPRPLGS